ncbi:sigma-70 family RNA polymerase sigma factor [Lentisphaera marina]|uniref:RNA polymerase sigma factor n=1 Tax=Lentisphaera marina TaxID=1111041 RepID=UPI0023668599|nr:sigma-70 family RNA polymerase sigma factor [Lentisphaera marina]MDD7984767.1 sigma-70 family RNA polymerase sigma factor [Lentisphaera marina]
MEDVYKTRHTLIQKVKNQHDNHAWEEFLQVYHKYIYAIIRSAGMNKDDAGDIMQDILLRLWNRLPKMDEGEIRRFRSYLATITKNCIADFIRKKMRHKDKLSHVAEKDVNLRSSELPEIDEIAIREWENYLTNQALTNISSSFSGKAIEAFKLTVQGYSLEEIANILDIQSQSVYRLRGRVKAKLIEEVARLREQLE